MGLNQSDGKATFVNISSGRLYTKEKDKLPVYFTDIDGTITKVEFKDEEYQGQHFEIARFTLTDRGEKYILQVRTDSGYFRGLCNSLKTGDPTQKVNICPSYKEKDGKPQTTCFVKQGGRTLKHAHTKDNMGALPPVVQVTFKGKTQWDGTDQITFWKAWLSGIEFEHEIIAGNENNSPEPITSGNRTDFEINEPVDDLPF